MRASAVDATRDATGDSGLSGASRPDYYVESLTEPDIQVSKEPARDSEPRDPHLRLPSP